MIWNGIDVSVHGPMQTAERMHASRGTLNWYTGYGFLAPMSSELVGEIPLEVRYADFCARLDAAMSKRAHG